MDGYSATGEICQTKVPSQKRCSLKKWRMAPDAKLLTMKTTRNSSFSVQACVTVIPNKICKSLNLFFFVWTSQTFLKICKTLSKRTENFFCSRYEVFDLLSILWKQLLRRSAFSEFKCNWEPVLKFTEYLTFHTYPHVYTVPTKTLLFPFGIKSLWNYPIIQRQLNLRNV